MDLVIATGDMTLQQIKDPAPNVESIPRGMSNLGTPAGAQAALSGSGGRWSSVRVGVAGGANIDTKQISTVRSQGAHWAGERDEAMAAFTLKRPPIIDGREWIAAKVETTSSPGPVSVQNNAFSLTSRDCGNHGGDLERCQLVFQRGRGTPVRIDTGFTGWVFVTSDGRYIVTEPLYVLDVREWKQYALFESLHIPNYTTIEAVSRDGKRLLISRKDCAIDCTDVRVEYYELTWP